MKRNIRMLSGLLALVMALTLFAGTALADTTHSFTIQVGDSFSKSYDNVGTASLESGSLPPGLSWKLSGTTFTISGTPTKGGSYSATFLTTSSKRTAGRGYLIVNVTFKFTVTLKLTTLDEIGIMTPKSPSGSSSSSSSSSSSTTVTPTPEPVTITKHPTNETVTEGGSCKFAAKADYYDKARWHFISPSGEDVNYSNLKKEFPQVEISGGSGHVMTVSNIPLAMDGYRVYCRYSNGDVNYAKTDTALLTVLPKDAPKAAAAAAATEIPAAVTPVIVYVTPEPTPIIIYVTPEPTPEPTAEPTQAPTAAPVVVPIQNGQGNVNTPGTGAQKDYTVLFVLAGAAVLVVLMLCVTLIVIGRMKAKERARRERERRRREREKQQKE